MKTLPQIFNQRNYSEKLGFGTGTIAEYGCYLCSFADCACYFGKDTNPLKLNEDFKAGNLYVDGNLLKDDHLNKIYGDLPLQSVDYYYDVAADLNKLKGYMADPSLFVIVMIWIPSLKSYHFSPVVDCDGTKVTLANPWGGVIQDFQANYGDPKTMIYKFVVYKGPAPTDPLKECLAQHTVLVDQNNKKDEEIKRLNDLVNTLQSTIKDKNNQIAKLTSDNQTLAGQLTDCQSRVQSLTEQAGKLPQLLQENEELKTQVTGYKSEVESLNRAVAQYKSRYTLVKLSIKRLIIDYLFPQIKP